MKLACQEQLLPGASLEEKWEFATAAGFAGIEQAVGLGQEVERATGAASVRVCADLFHMNIEEDDLAAAIRAAGPRIAHVHVDDTNRLQPGTGHMDFRSVFDALRAVGYDDWLTLECQLRGAPEVA